MSCDRIAFELYDMNLKKNRVLIDHIYNQTHKMPPKNHEHPLEMICDTVRLRYDLDVQIEIGQSKAKVDLVFNDTYDTDKIKLVTNRVQHTIVHLLDAKIVKIYKKIHH